MATDLVGDSYGLLFGDCLERMHEIPDGSVDAVVCDLPYQTTQNSWDVIIPFEPLWVEYKRVCKENAAVILTSAQPFTSALVASNPAWFKYDWVWHKTKATGHLNAHHQPMRNKEDILVFAAGATTYNPQGLVSFKKKVRRGSNGGNFGKSGTENFQEYTNYPRQILEFDSEPNPQHPTQKPVALMEYLIRTYTNPGEVVLDNTMGSGTTGVAAVNTGRIFVGIERDEKYFKIACDRIVAASVIPEKVSA